MLFHRIILAAAPLIFSAAAAAIDTRLIRRDGGLQGRATFAYSGDGSTQTGWPSTAQWISSFDVMFDLNTPTIRISCAQFGVQNNSEDEIKDLRKAITEVAASIALDARFILAVMMQESKGCTRVPSTFNSVLNPGLMQSHAGQGTCNSNGAVTIPCSYAMIKLMIRDGSAGTGVTDNFALEPLLQKAGGPGKASSYYKAARMYNSGSIAVSGLLEEGIGATNSYASDIAQRLTGTLTT